MRCSFMQNTSCGWAFCWRPGTGGGSNGSPSRMGATIRRRSLGDSRPRMVTRLPTPTLDWASSSWATAWGRLGLTPQAAAKFGCSALAFGLSWDAGWLVGGCRCLWNLGRLTGPFPALRRSGAIGVFWVIWPKSGRERPGAEAHQSGRGLATGRRCLPPACWH